MIQNSIDAKSEIFIKQASTAYKIEKVQRRLMAIRFELIGLKSREQAKEVDKEEIQLFFNQCKARLGDLIVRDIKEVEEIKNIVDSFKDEIIGQRILKLEAKEKEELAMLKNLRGSLNERAQANDGRSTRA